MENNILFTTLISINAFAIPIAAVFLINRYQNFIEKTDELDIEIKHSISIMNDTFLEKNGIYQGYTSFDIFEKELPIQESDIEKNINYKIGLIHDACVFLFSPIEKDINNLEELNQSDLKKINNNTLRIRRLINESFQILNKLQLSENLNSAINSHKSTFEFSEALFSKYSPEVKKLSIALSKKQIIEMKNSHHDNKRIKILLFIQIIVGIIIPYFLLGTIPYESFCIVFFDQIGFELSNFLAFLLGTISFVIYFLLYISFLKAIRHTSDTPNT